MERIVRRDDRVIGTPYTILRDRGMLIDAIEITILLPWNFRSCGARTDSERR